MPTSSGGNNSFGNVKDRPFSEIWTDMSNPLMKKLKDKKAIRHRPLRHLQLAECLRR